MVCYGIQQSVRTFFTCITVSTKYQTVRISFRGFMDSSAVPYRNATSLRFLGYGYIRWLRRTSMDRLQCGLKDQGMMHTFHWGQACTGIDELMATQPFKRSRMALRFTSPEWEVRGRPSLTHSSYFSKAETMELKSGRFEGLAAQQRFMRCASAGWQLAGNGGRAFCTMERAKRESCPMFRTKSWELDKEKQEN